MHYFWDLDDLPAINKVWLYNDFKVLDLQAVLFQLSRLSIRLVDQRSSGLAPLEVIFLLL